MRYEQFRRQVKPAAVPFDITIPRLRLSCQGEGTVYGVPRSDHLQLGVYLGAAHEIIAVFPRLAPDAEDTEPGQPRVIEVPTLLAPSEIGAWITRLVIRWGLIH